MIGGSLSSDNEAKKSFRQLLVLPPYPKLRTALKIFLMLSQQGSEIMFILENKKRIITQYIENSACQYKTQIRLVF